MHAPAPVKLYRTPRQIVLERDGRLLPMREATPWNWLINQPDLAAYLRSFESPADDVPRVEGPCLAPVDGQEVWAAGVTYARSRTARIEESQDAGGGSFYDAVYTADRPELFFKASPWRVCASGRPVRIRRDARWSVPEPELALCVNAAGRIVGYTIGNDMSSRDIEGENPLYLPQAKIYDGACALGPAVLIREDPLPTSTAIAMTVERQGTTVFEGSTTLSQMRRTPEALVEWLFRETSFPLGCVLLTGTGIVPPDDFTLQVGDEVAIEIAPIGRLVNTVA
jgi:2-dehydro-3-deoxy-D-arabinonate dehydratase